MKKKLMLMAAMVVICLTACAQNGKKSAKASSNKALVAYFSATGNTAREAKLLAAAAGADIFEITPAQKYTSADLDWHVKTSRSTLENNDPKSRPALKNAVLKTSNYSTVFLGYPIWWGVAPKVINTFIEKYNLRGKTIIPFATSGGSDISKSVKALKATYPNLTFKNGKLMNGMGQAEIKKWLNSIGYKK